jgi:predicted  nucleic acid-binding Zn-ribbon protein
MALTIALKPSLEKRLKEGAQQKGVQLTDFISQLLEQMLPETTPVRPKIVEPEMELLEQINQKLSNELWERSRFFRQKLQDGTISPTEQEEYTQLNHQIEADTVRRVSLVVELAKLRNVPAKELLEDFFPQPTY